MRVGALVGLGGMLGGLARLGLLEIAGADRAVGWLLAINVAGSGLLGLLVGSTSTQHPWVRPFVGTGVLGGFTTFSAAIATTVELADGASWLTPTAYLAATLAASVIGAGVGLAAGESFRRRRRGVSTSGDAARREVDA